MNLYKYFEPVPPKMTTISPSTPLWSLATKPSHACLASWPRITRRLRTYDNKEIHTFSQTYTYFPLPTKKLSSQTIFFSSSKFPLFNYVQSRNFETVR